VYCWGYGENGQLRDDAASDSYVPVAALGLGAGATAVSAGYGHTCAVKNGAAYCWGYNGYGRVGDGSNDNWRYVPVPVIGAGSGVTDISAGEYHSCAVVAGGVRCWGGNGEGQLGNGTQEDSDVPVQAIP